MSQFHISDENPNDVVGGKGCLCHPRGGDETRGPFLIFPATTTDDNLSPHTVLCANCACDGQADVADYQFVPPVIDIPAEDVEEVVEPTQVTI